MSLEWYEKSVIYHIYLPAFKDGNNDGIGDFKGLISKLNYFEELKVTTLLLSPFFPSPMKDNGYDITSYVDIDPMYGTMDDFDELMFNLKKKGMHIIIDFVANHTSDQHTWFQKSILREDPYTNYYIWVDQHPKSESTPLPPNNWLSVFNGSAWTWNDKRKQFYFHQFLPEQPDLNHRYPLVKKKMKKILQFWLEKGVDGFRIDAASHLIEDKAMKDEPVAKKSNAKKGEHAYLNHIYTKGNIGNIKLIAEWKKILNDFSPYPKKAKILLVEAIEKIEDVMRYYGTSEAKVSDIPMNFQFYKVKQDSTGIDLQKIINDWLSKMPKGKFPNWVMSSHDDPRVVSRVGRTLAGSLQMVMMLLPGIPIWYYGDELGMENGDIQLEDMKDSFALRTVPSNSRDPMRTPMQWNNERNAGFSDSGSLWLPVNPSYEQTNVEVEKEDPNSFLNNFKKLLSIREEPAIMFSPLQYPIVTKQIFSIKRSIVGGMCYLLVLNMSSKPITIDMNKEDATLPEKAFVEVTNSEKYKYMQNPTLSVGDTNSNGPSNEIPIANCSTVSSSLNDPIPSTSHAEESVPKSVRIITLNNISLEPHEAVVLSYPSIFY